MADSAYPRRATGAPPRRGRGTPTPLCAGDGRIQASTRNRFAPLGELELELEEVAAGPAQEPVAAGPDPAPLPPVPTQHPLPMLCAAAVPATGATADLGPGHRHPPPRSPDQVPAMKQTLPGAGSQASSSTAPTMDPGSSARRLPPRGTELESRWVTDESGQHLLVFPSHRRRQSFLSQASSSAAPAPVPSSDHPGALGRTRVLQSVLYSDRPRHSRPRRLARAEATVVGSSEVHSPVMDLLTIETLSLGDPSLSTPETAEMTNVDYAPRSEQEEHTCEVNSSEFDMEVIEELSSSDPPLLPPQTETDEELTDDDIAWVPPTRQTKFFFNRPKGISRDMVLSRPFLTIIPDFKEQRPKHSDVDPEELKRSIKEYLDARPCINLDIAPDSILAIEMARNARAAELGEPQLPSVTTEQDSVAAAHHQHSMVPTESRHEASAEEIVPNGTAWMNEEVMLCFKFIAMNEHLVKLEDYCLDELQHQCFNVESYDKVYHHYNFTVRMKMPEADWKVKLYFAEVKEVFREKYYLCYPLDPNENGLCYACKNQGVEDLRHPAIDLYEMGSPDASCNFCYFDDESDESDS